MHILIGFCNQNINTTGRYNVEYETTPSYTRSTATLRCNEGYALARAGSAVCGSNGQWIINYPDCRGTYSMILFFHIYTQAHVAMHICIYMYILGFNFCIV